MRDVAIRSSVLFRSQEAGKWIHVAGDPEGPSAGTNSDLREPCVLPGGYALIRVIGRSVLRRHFCIHHPSVDRPSAYNRSGPSNPLRKSRGFSPFRIPCNVWKAMVEPIRIDRSTRDRHRTQPESAKQVRRHRCAAFRPCDGVFAIDASLVALLLFGCALSRYLWGISTTVTSVTLGVTSFGVIFCLFIVVARTISTQSLYQTPGSRFLRYLRREVPGPLGSAVSIVVSGALTAGPAFSNTFGRSKIVKTHTLNAGYYHPWWSAANIGGFLKGVASTYRRALAIDAYRLRRAIVGLSVPITTCQPWNTLQRFSYLLALTQPSLQIASIFLLTVSESATAMITWR